MKIFSRLFRKVEVAEAAALVAKHGARVRARQWEAKRNAVAAQLCHEMGKPVPQVLR